MTIQYQANIALLLLVREIEQFLYAEADMLDDRRYEQWLDLLTEDVRYWMPMARNFQYGDEAREWTRELHDLAWFDEGKITLTQRVQQIMTGIHWAEEPSSRVTHMVSNVEVVDAVPSAEAPEEVTIKCRFLVHRSRLQDETDLMVGKRRDMLRRLDGHWKIARREIFLDQNVLLAKNLTIFF